MRVKLSAVGVLLASVVASAIGVSGAARAQTSGQLGNTNVTVGGYIKLD
jgi:hypothetical protein